MGCSECNKGTRGSCTNENCVIKIVKDIVKAQHQAVEVAEDSCPTSCDRSIAELLSPVGENQRPQRHTTIPFMLICKASCKTFVGTGFRKVNNNNSSAFECMESPVFRVRSFVKGGGSCVKLELLTPVNQSVPTIDKSGEGGSFCDRFGGELIENFRATGICITVDLNCFCGISCLDPITPAR